MCVSGHHGAREFIGGFPPGAGVSTSMTRTQRWILLIASLASFVVALDTLVVSTALSSIRTDLSATVEELEWTVNAYNLAFAVMLMTAAGLGDRWGRRRLFAGGIAVFAVTSAASALAPSVGALIAARALQGAAAAFVMTLGLALVSQAFPPEKRASALGLFFAVTGLAVASGPLVGGAVTEGIAWQWIFWINVPLGLLLAPVALARIPESRGPDAALDLRGLALVTAGVLGIVWALVRGNAAGWGSLEVVGTLAAGLVLLAAFIAWELRAPAPMLPMRFFRSRAFSAGNAAIFCAVGGLFTAVFFLSQFLQVVLAYGPLGAGLRVLPWTATLFFVAPVAGSLVERFGERPFMVAGPLLQAVGMGWIALVAGAGMSYGEMIAPLIVAGVGISMSFPAAQNSVIGSVPPSAIGKAAGTNSTMRELGGVFGIAIGVAAFAGAGGYATPDAFADGFKAAMGVAAGLSLLAAAAGALLPGRAPATVPLPAVPGPAAERQNAVSVGEPTPL
jgi:EmrB/QacA subfamily drug resistance transporter